MSDSAADRELLHLWFEDNRHLVRWVISPLPNFACMPESFITLLFIRFTMTETNRDGVLADDTPTEAVSTNSKASPPPSKLKVQPTERRTTRREGK